MYIHTCHWSYVLVICLFSLQKLWRLQSNRLVATRFDVRRVRYAAKNHKFPRKKLSDFTRICFANAFKSGFPHQKLSLLMNVMGCIFTDRRQSGNGPPPEFAVSQSYKSMSLIANLFFTAPLGSECCFCFYHYAQHPFYTLLTALGLTGAEVTPNVINFYLPLCFYCIAFRQCILFFSFFASFAIPLP